MDNSPRRSEDSRRGDESQIQSLGDDTLPIEIEIPYRRAKLFDADTASDYNTQANANLAREWIQQLKEQVLDVLARRATPKPVRIAILDTGFDGTNALIRDELPKIKGQKSWLETQGRDEAVPMHNDQNLNRADRDSCGHGTHVTWLVSQIAPKAELYIGQVVKERLESKTAERVAKAIQHATKIWRVDIITMSFGFPGRGTVPVIQSAIKEAVKNDILIFAAASNDGQNNEPPIAYPAREESVFAIGSTDYYGNLSRFSPPTQRDSHSFATLGEALNSAWPNHLQGPMHLMSGTSVACPIAAVIAALVIEYVRQQPKIPDPEIFLEYSCMRKVFEKMAGKSMADHKYLAPWKLLGDGLKEGRQAVLDDFLSIYYAYMEEKDRAAANLIKHIATESEALFSAHPFNFSEASTSLKIAATSNGATDSNIRISVEANLLQSLQYSRMTERQEDIKNPYEKTFRWIFEDPVKHGKLWENFGEWLRTGNGIYWISGKAASGKSTLMRYIYDNQLTKDLLKTWSKDHGLNLAGFFFWNSGTIEQRSLKGLLRSLLYQTLIQQRELIPHVLSEQWIRIYNAVAHSENKPSPFQRLESNQSEDWNIPKLKKAFRQLTTQMAVSTRLCFFIDGLDEYDGDHNEIAQLFKDTAGLLNVKMCISSRPWNVFKDAFEGLPHLRLQELTEEDIKFVVDNSLTKNRRFAKLAIQNPESANDLVKEIVGKADGVFLWVKLVISSLITGLYNGDELVDLEARLVLLPAKLENLYEHILTHQVLTNIEPNFYHEQASRIFQIHRAAREARELLTGSRDEAPQSLTILELLLAYGDDWQQMANDRRLVFTRKELNAKSQDMALRLNSRCGGLLELGRVPQTVSYLHRTAKDFLDQPRIWNIILGYTNGSEFNPNIALIRSTILSLKIMFNEETSSLYNLGLDPWRSAPDEGSTSTLSHEAWLNISLAMIYAHRVELDVGRIDETVLDELNRVADEQHQKAGPSPVPWSTRRPRLAQGEPHKWYDSFLSIAIEYGLYSYIRCKLSKCGEVPKIKFGRPLLDYAVSPTSSVYYPVPPALSYQNRLQIISLLLEKGASPNEPFLHGTPWVNALSYAYTYLRPKARPDSERLVEWLEIFEILVRYGASPRVYCDDPEADDRISEEGTYHRQISALIVIDAVFMAQIPSHADSLRRKLVELGATADVKEVRREAQISNSGSVGLKWDGVTWFKGLASWTGARTRVARRPPSNEPSIPEYDFHDSRNDEAFETIFKMQFPGR